MQCLIWVAPTWGPFLAKTVVRFAHIDIDPPKEGASFTEGEREDAYSRLLAAKPSTINWSGNGWQGLWRLGEGVSKEEVEQINKGLIEKLGGDKGKLATLQEGAPLLGQQRRNHDVSGCGVEQELPPAGSGRAEFSRGGGTKG